MKFDKQKAFLFAVLGLALIAIIFGTSSIYADNQANDSAKSTAAVSVGNKSNHEKPKPKQKQKQQTKKEAPAPMASVKPAPVTDLPQTGQFLHIGVTATGIFVLFLVSLIVLNRQFQTKLQKLAKQHEN